MPGSSAVGDMRYRVVVRALLAQALCAVCAAICWSKMDVRVDSGVAMMALDADRWAIVLRLTAERAIPDRTALRTAEQDLADALTLQRDLRTAGTATTTIRR